MAQNQPHRLAGVAPDLERILTHGRVTTSPLVDVSQIRCQTVFVNVRDGVRLATDLYLPPVQPAPVVAMRTPYGRAADAFVGLFFSMARRGYAVVSQDCRGTGDSEPDSWDYYIYEPEDGLDFVEWVTQQCWYGGFLGSFGGSYIGQTQWQMAMHPRMSTIVPQVSGLGIAVNTARLYMFLNASSHTIGKGDSKISVHFTEMERMFQKETEAGGYFNEPLHKPFAEALVARFPQLSELAPCKAKSWLWTQYCGMTCAQRAAFLKQALGAKNITGVDVESLPAIFGHRISHDAHTLPHTEPSKLCMQLHAPPLMITGWYDWGLNDALATWELFRREARESVSSRSRLIITPGAHAAPGYYEDIVHHPELLNSYRYNVELFMRWYDAVREGATDTWPAVIYYLMGANEWHTASDWPVPEARQAAFYLGSGGTLSLQAPRHASEPDRYTYDPQNPTPTIGGSIVSWLYPPGSVDVSAAQRRADVLTYTTPPLDADLDVVGPLRMLLYASSSALDTDFVARLSDVFPDGRALQLQSGILRARYREIDEEPQWLEPGRVSRFDIDLWATANRFKAGHRMRVDISSADFPHFDRNANRGGESGDPIPAHQAVYHDPGHASRLLVSVLNNPSSSAK